MRSKPLKFWALFLFVVMTSLAYGQVIPAAHEGSAPIEVGGGISAWSTNWGPGYMLGIQAFADIHPPFPGRLRGLGAEMEFRDVDWHRSFQPPNYKQMTIGGGPLYTYPFRQNLRFYGKFLIDYGSIDFTFADNPGYTHDTRMVYAPGGGAQFRIHKNLWARADYEYQIWPKLFSATKSVTPYGYTFGVGYDLRSFHR